MKNETYVILAGTSANPPHFAHAVFIERLLAHAQCEIVVWRPSGTRRDKAGYVAAEHRDAMSKLLVQYVREHTKCGERLVYDDTEVHNSNSESTIRVLEHMQKRMPNKHIAWSSGSDVFFHRAELGGMSQVRSWWEQGNYLMETWPCFVLVREGYNKENMLDMPRHAISVPGILSPTSSTFIRQELQLGRSVSQALLPQVILEYVLSHRLYTSS